mgnify:CR=1 FL=1
MKAINKNLFIVCLSSNFLLIPFVFKAKNFEYEILIKQSERKLFLLENSKVIRSYKIAVPKNSYVGVIRGEVYQVIIDPVWIPTEKTRADLARKGIKLPRVVSPYIIDKRNALGKAALKIQFDRESLKRYPYLIYVLIHGTNDPESIGKKITRGCIRMYNEDILEMIGIISNAKTRVTILE